MGNPPQETAGLNAAGNRTAVEAPPELARRLTLVDSIAIVVGIMAGDAISRCRT
jgi:hypothetical protein